VRRRPSPSPCLMSGSRRLHSLSRCLLSERA
jgi:hypothetical protein